MAASDPNRRDTRLPGSTPLSRPSVTVNIRRQRSNAARGGAARNDLYKSDPVRYAEEQGGSEEMYSQGLTPVNLQAPRTPEDEDDIYVRQIGSGTMSRAGGGVPGGNPSSGIYVRQIGSGTMSRGGSPGSGGAGGLLPGLGKTLATGSARTEGGEMVHPDEVVLSKRDKRQLSPKARREVMAKAGPDRKRGGFFNELSQNMRGKKGPGSAVGGAIYDLFSQLAGNDQGKGKLAQADRYQRQVSAAKAKARADYAREQMNRGALPPSQPVATEDPYYGERGSKKAVEAGIEHEERGGNTTPYGPEAEARRRRR